MPPVKPALFKRFGRVYEAWTTHRDQLPTSLYQEPTAGFAVSFQVGGGRLFLV
jgi:hypothetical protein